MQVPQSRALQRVELAEAERAQRRKGAERPWGAQRQVPSSPREATRCASNRAARPSSRHTGCARTVRREFESGDGVAQLLRGPTSPYGIERDVALPLDFDGNAVFIANRSRALATSTVLYSTSRSTLQPAILIIQVPYGTYVIHQYTLATRRQLGVAC